MKGGSLLVFAVLTSFTADYATCQTEAVTVQVDFGTSLGPLEIDKMSLGQGGLSPKPMWDPRVPEIRALRPRLIRIFLQEYFRLLPDQGVYYFDLLDESLDTILATGAKPLMCICFKPSQLFPEVNQDQVEPVDYAAWEELVFQLVRHYKDRGAGITYWEVGNEPDIGEDGGCPYRFQPESYVRYYQHTAAAIRRADSNARVGGPALANSRSPILPALLDAANAEGTVTPLDFVSWHIYSSDPIAVRGTIEYVEKLLKEYPAVRPETFLDEWNMDLMNPPLDPRFQPCYVAETIWQMKAAGLDYSCYYHIRDWHVDIDEFSRFMSPHGTAFMTRWWNRMPQFDGLFDYQNRVRPTYFVFKLLSRLRGERLQVEASNAALHGFATRDDQLRMWNLLLWNFSGKACSAAIYLQNVPEDARSRHITLDATDASDDENVRLRPDPFSSVPAGNSLLTVEMQPYAVHYWSFE